MLNILYQDEYLVAVFKPGGLLVHRSMIDRHETAFAMQMVRDQIGQHVYTVHRLDKPTSGVLLFALSSEVAKRLTEQFTAGGIRKRYEAIVRGHAPTSGHIDHALKEKLDKIADRRARQDKPAQDAQTDFRRMACFELPFTVGRYPSARYSLVELLPKTGRKHQLRRHMSHINHPILGDVNHGDNKHNKFARTEFAFRGLALCATQLALSHPMTNAPLVIDGGRDGRIDKLLSQWHPYRQNNGEK